MTDADDDVLGIDAIVTCMLRDACGVLDAKPDTVVQMRRPDVSEDDLLRQMRELRAIGEDHAPLLQKLQDDLQALREEVAQLRRRQPPTDAVGRTPIRG
jgi:hypothetical protein